MTADAKSAAPDDGPVGEVPPEGHVLDAHSAQFQRDSARRQRDAANARADAAVVRLRAVASAAADLWRESQADGCRIREAGVMQEHVWRVLAALGVSTDDMPGDDVPSALAALGIPVADAPAAPEACDCGGPTILHGHSTRCAVHKARR